MNILFFDSESCGIPVWKEPSGSENQPHLVQLGALLCDDNTAEVIETMDVIIAPDGWDIPDDTIEVHGITQERALAEGIPESVALDMFISLYNKCDLRVAHNTTFDNRMIRIALKRYQPDLILDEEWKDREKYYCTLMNSKKIMGGKSGHTLTEAYKFFTGKEIEDAHSALPDARACAEIYWAIKDGRTTQCPMI